LYYAVLVTEDARSAEFKSTHVIMGPSDIAGHGLFNVKELQPDDLIGAYTGQIRLSAADEKDPNLLTVAMKSGKIIDPSIVGGLLCLCNQGHGQKANMDISEGRIKGYRNNVGNYMLSDQSTSVHDLVQHN
jgi:hypothetical protein